MARRRTIIVGDLHGMLLEFRELMDKCSYNKEEDRLILAGDLVDRGPDSAGVIEYAQEIDAELCIGNHDDKYIRYRKHERKKTHTGRKHYKNPMVMSPEKIKVWKSLTDDHVDYLESGKYCIPLWEYNTIVVHAGVLPGDVPVDKRDRKEYIFTRFIDKETFEHRSLGPDFTKPEGSIHWTEVYDGYLDVIYGHDVQSFDEPVIRQNHKGSRTIGIDTGSCFGGNLTAFILTPENPRGSYEQVKAKKCWYKYQIVRDEK